MFLGASWSSYSVNTSWGYTSWKLFVMIYVLHICNPQVLIALHNCDMEDYFCFIAECLSEVSKLQECKWRKNMAFLRTQLFFFFVPWTYWFLKVTYLQKLLWSNISLLCLHFLNNYLVYFMFLSCTNRFIKLGTGSFSQRKWQTPLMRGVWHWR